MVDSSTVEVLVLMAAVLVAVVEVVTIITAENGNLEVPVYFLKGKQGYTVRKMEKKCRSI
jgi:hypothetical protein